MKDFKLFFTGAGSPGFSGILKGFRIGAKEDGREIKVITADMNPDAYGFHLADKGYVIPPGNEDDFLEKMLEICDKEKPRFLVSGVDPELLPLAKAKPDFRRYGVEVVLSDWKAIELAQDKGKLYDFFKPYGFVPEYKRVKNVKEFKEAVSSLGYPEKPVCFKPVFSYGMRGFRIMRPDVDKVDLLFKYKPSSAFINFSEALDTLKQAEAQGRFPELLVMEYLEGKEYTVDLLAWKGKSLVTIPRERVVTKEGISTVAKLEKNKEIIEYAETITEKLGFDYCINMQFRYSSDGYPKLIEVQPRFAGTTIACIGAGANLPYLALKLALGEKIPEVKVKWGTVMKRFWDEVFVLGEKQWFYGIKFEVK